MRKNLKSNILNSEGFMNSLNFRKIIRKVLSVYFALRPSSSLDDVTRSARVLKLSFPKR
jgi:hypothetical protein